jgi:hypothetical protein
MRPLLLIGVKNLMELTYGVLIRIELQAPDVNLPL